MKTRPGRWILSLAACVFLVSAPAARSQRPDGPEGSSDGPPPAQPPAAPVDVRSAPLPRLLPPRSLSTSKQFVVFAESGALRAAVGLLGEDVRDGVRRLLGPEATERWKIPVVVDLRRPVPGLPGALAPSRLTLAQTGLGLKIQLELLLGDAGRTVSPRAELARALLLEIAYRDTPNLPAGRSFLQPPAWLAEGLSAYLDTRADDTGALADGMADLLGAPRAALPLCDFLSQDPAGLDSPSHRLYRAYAYGLVRILAEELPGGRDALLGLLRALPENSDASLCTNPGPLLARLLPENAGRDPVARERWWTAARTRFAEIHRSMSVLSAEETERRLAALLFVTMPAGAPPGPRGKKAGAPATSPGGPPAAGRVMSLEEFAREEDPGTNARRAALTPVRAGLLVLLGRAHPFLRPVVAGYEGTVEALARGGTEARRTGERLRALAAERAAVHTRAEAIADYLNWFEATQPSLPSDAFESYFQTVRQNAADEHRAGRRRADPISTYLDAVEAEF